MHIAVVNFNKLINFCPKHGGCMRFFLSLTLTFLLFTSNIAFAAKIQKMIYIPIDNRPVSLDYVEETFSFYGIELITPPENLLSTHNHSGNPEALMKWLLKNANKSDIAIIAADSLIYGGLVPSRKHNDDIQTLLKRAQAINMIKYANKDMKIYVYSSLMRTPWKSTSFVEPSYYEEYGSMFFRLSQLLDKEDLYGGLDFLDATEKKNYLSIIPQEYQNDWFARRKKNLAIHHFLIDSFKAGYFNSLTIGKDDNAPLSQTHYEARILNKSISYFDHNIRILPGIDQLGMLLLTKAVFEANIIPPKVYVLYNTGAGGQTIPAYSDQTLASSVLEQLRLLGGEYSFSPKDADMILAVNSPDSGITPEASANSNITAATTREYNFAKQINTLAERGAKISVADVAFGNGSSNSFMKAMSNSTSFDKIYAYSGWNTADNTIGYALAQGILSTGMSKDQRTALLKTRLLDDWIYQANVRQHVLKKHFHTNIYKQYFLGQDTAEYVDIVGEAMGEEVSYIPYLNTTQFVISLPWSRMFEVKIKVPVKK